MNIRILIADDHPIVRLALKEQLSRTLGVSVIGFASNSTELMDRARVDLPDVILTDYYMPGGAYGDGQEMIAGLLKELPGARVVVLTMSANAALLTMLARSGVHGLLLKTDEHDEIVQAVFSVARGSRYQSRGVKRLLERWALRPAVGEGDPLAALSPREREVVLLYLTGMRITDIAHATGRSIKTIGQQKGAALAKLGIANDYELFEFARQQDLLQRE